LALPAKHANQTTNIRISNRQASLIPGFKHNTLTQAALKGRTLAWYREQRNTCISRQSAITPLNAGWLASVIKLLVGGGARLTAGRPTCTQYARVSVCLSVTATRQAQHYLCSYDCY
jgi:hypothetical protein